MHNVRLVRMETGEDIMASVLELEDNMLQLDDPMRLVFRRLPTGQTIMMMMPWLPMEIIKVNSAKIDAYDIVTMVEPKEAMIEYYDKLVAKTIEDMSDSDLMLQQLLEQQDEEDNNEEDVELSNELEDLLKDIKSKKLH